ncbi:MAG: hypothetical protein JRC87_12195 [Deltaproteobacteria bacterium]|nr:hypothetical protein [Deltaproteobacteria bacterium]
MNCTNFTSWLENRDTHDISEADRAMKHASGCTHCKELLQKDEELELFVAKVFRYEKIDQQLYNKIDRGLMVPRRKRQYRSGVAALFGVAVMAVIFYAFSFSPGNFGSIDELGKYVVQEHLEHGRVTPLFEQIGNVEEWGREKLQDSFSVNTIPAGNMEIVGGRICIIKNCNFAHLLYQDKLDLYSLFVTSGKEIGFSMEPGRMYTLTISGVELHIWQKDKMVYALTG